MTNTSKTNKRTFTYRNFHGLIYCQAIVPIICFIMSRIKGNHTADGKLEFILVEAVLVTIFILISRHFYKMDVKDELVQYNLAKANKITLYAVIAVLLIGIFINDCFIKGFINSNFCWLTAMGTIALRSMLYTFFDSPANKDEESDEE